MESDPSGADVRLSTGEKCVTPCTLEKKRKHRFVVYIEKPGYQPAEVNVVSQVANAGAAGMAGNVLVGGLIGVGVDAASGATKELIPNPVQVDLQPANRREEVASSRKPGLMGSSLNRSGNAASGGRPTGDSALESAVVLEDAPEDRLAAALDHKLHETIEGSHYIWLDLRWTSTFDDETIWHASGKLRISHVDTDREALVPWTFERELLPGATVAEEESGFEVRKTGELAWLLHSETEDLEVEYVPRKIVFADGTEKTY